MTRRLGRAVHVVVNRCHSWPRAGFTWAGYHVIASGAMAVLPLSPGFGARRIHHGIGVLPGGERPWRAPFGERDARQPFATIGAIESWNHQPRRIPVLRRQRHAIDLLSDQHIGPQALNGERAGMMRQSASTSPPAHRLQRPQRIAAALMHASHRDCGESRKVIEAQSAGPLSSMPRIPRCFSLRNRSHCRRGPLLEV